MNRSLIHKLSLLSAACLTTFCSHAGPGTYQGLPLANPHLAILPADSAPNYDYWLQNSSTNSGSFTKSQSLNTRTSTSTQVNSSINEQESSEFFGENDTKENAQSLTIDYGQLTGLYGMLTVQAQPQTFTDSVSQSLEQNDTSSSATSLNMATTGIRHTVEGSLNDGSQSFNGRDYDIHKLSNLNPNLPLYIEYTANEYNDAYLSFADESRQKFINYNPEFYSVLPFFNHFQTDLYVAIGASTLTTKEGFDVSTDRNGFSILDHYQVTFYQGEIDLDYYKVNLNEGDLLSISSNYSNVLLQIESPLQRFVAGISALGFIYPSDSPAIKTGSSNIAYTATESGEHTIIV